MTISPFSASRDLAPSDPDETYVELATRVSDITERTNQLLDNISAQPQYGEKYPPSHHEYQDQSQNRGWEEWEDESMAAEEDCYSIPSQAQFSTRELTVTQQQLQETVAQIVSIINDSNDVICTAVKQITEQYPTSANTRFSAPPPQMHQSSSPARQFRTEHA